MPSTQETTQLVDELRAENAELRERLRMAEDRLTAIRAIVCGDR